MKFEQYQKLLAIMELVDDIESMLHYVSENNGKGKQARSFRENCITVASRDINHLRHCILDII